MTTSVTSVSVSPTQDSRGSRRGYDLVNDGTSWRWAICSLPTSSVHRRGTRRVAGSEALDDQRSKVVLSMYPGDYVDTNPDKPAIIMAATGEVHDVRRARRRGQPLSPPAARGRPAARRPRRALHGEPPPLPRGGVGLPLRRGRLHGVLVAPDERRAVVHPQRLRGQGVHHVEVQGRPGRRDRRRHARRRRCG